MALGLIVIASVGKFGGAHRRQDRRPHLASRWRSAAAMKRARLDQRWIVATIGLPMGALSQNLFR